jgi:SagB-type dehydrogenase family enzyme
MTSWLDINRKERARQRKKQMIHFVAVDLVFSTIYALSCTMKKYNTHPDLLFTVNSGQLIALNFQTQEQFEISKEYVDLLCRLSSDNEPDHLTPEDRSRVQELIDNHLLLETSSEKRETPERKSWKWGVLARAFHFGTFHHQPPGYEGEPETDGLNYLDSLSNSSPVENSTLNDSNQNYPPVTLPQPKPITQSLSESLHQRVTTRRSEATPIALEDLSTLLWESFAYRTVDNSLTRNLCRELNMEAVPVHRSSPSTGGLNSSECYVIVRHVIGLKPGIYHYQSHSHGLGFAGAIPDDFKLALYLTGQMYADEYAAGLVITSRFDKLWTKYTEDRSYRFALLEIGHLSQTALLAATGLGLNTWVTGQFFDDELRSLLKIPTESHEYPLFFIGLGKGPKNPIDRYFEATVKKYRKDRPG